MKINRIAVSIFFFINGFLYANWTSRLPELQEFFNVSNTGLGFFLLISAGGALIAMPFSGWLTTQFGTQKVTTVASLLFCASLPFMALSPNHFILSPLFFFIGFCAGSMDVSMNGQAVLVERSYNKSIMSSFHAVFSIGMALGAGAGALFTKFDISLVNHLFSVSGLSFIVVFWSSFNLVNDTPQVVTEGNTKHFVLPTKAILPLGIIAFCSMTGEGSMTDWSAIFMNKVIGQSEVFSALAFGAFATAMTIGRLFGDAFTDRFGHYKILIIDSLLAIVGLSIVLIFVTTWTTLLGFFIVGLGLSTIVPIIYSKAGNTENVSPSVGIAMATSIGYAGFFVGPPAIGFISDLFGLRLGLGFTLFLFVIMAIFVTKTFKSE